MQSGRESPIGEADQGARSGGSRGHSAPPPAGIGPYRVLEELGRGGMARVYKVTPDTDGARTLALKLLHVQKREHLEQSAALFEREFHTLVQLSHPSVIEVYDYGIADEGPYYTMELLDGGDLRARSPLPWREACAVAFDVCSSLALLHSRRLVHRDITPRNVRCTRDGNAKLIDFGAMAPMGPCSHVVGTPAFIAPEVLHRAALDGKADLYSLGATLYYALTGRVPYFARDLSGVLAAWRNPPAAPSLLVAGIPGELDRLVLSMLSLEPALRPRSAYEVMQRLHAIAGIDRAESESVERAYLATPSLVGRDQAHTVFRRHMQRAVRARGGGLLVEARAGLGRSRLLDAFALSAKLLGGATLRAAGISPQSAPLSVARALAEQLLHAHPNTARACAHELGAIGVLFEPEADALPSISHSAQPSALRLRAFPDAPADQLAFQGALAHWFLRVSRQLSLLVAIDDVDRADEASVALLAALAHGAGSHRLLVAVTAEAVRPEQRALEALAGHCTKLSLTPLDRDETETLLGSVFGDVPNLAMLADRIHGVAQGRPRECIALAEHLVERGVITYARGSWTLPAELAPGDLPARAGDVFGARVAALTPRARHLARLQSLAVYGTFGRQDYALLEPDASTAEIETAVSDLLFHDVVRAEGASYTLSHPAVRDALAADVSDAERPALHARLAELHELTGRPVLGTVSHLLGAGLAERALDLVSAAIAQLEDPRDAAQRLALSVQEVGDIVGRALDAGERLTRSRRERCELHRWLLLCSATSDDRFHTRTAKVVLAQLEQDSGLAFYRELSAVADPTQRLMQALQRASERYAATPEHERVYDGQTAIQWLVYYVVVSIAVGARTHDVTLLASLPGLLEPFAPLTPVLRAMWQNALATTELMYGQPERAYVRWSALHRELEQIDAAQLPAVDLIRNAIAFGLGSLDAQLGRDTVGHWAAILDRDPLQQVNAMYLRRLLCLHRGDFQTAERFRRKAEVMAVQANVRQMFTNPLIVELNIAALMQDLTGVKQVADRVEPLAAKHLGWQPFRGLAEAHFHRLRGDLTAARDACERVLELIAPGGKAERTVGVSWAAVASCYLEVLVELEQYAEAAAYGERALQTCAELEIVSMALGIIRPLALAQAKLGDYAGASARLEAVIAGCQQHGMQGLTLGAFYEARARIAIWAGDAETVERFGQLAAREYRHGRASPLGGRYERLLQEAVAAGIRSLPQLDAFGPTHVGATALGGVRPTLESSATTAMRTAEDPVARAEVALGLLCEAHAARAGHLFLITDAGLRLRASVGAEPPPPDVQTFLTTFWQRQLVEADLPTAFIPEGTPALATELWTDARGTPYQPVVVSCVVDRNTLHVGIAALVSSDIPRTRENAAQVVATVAGFLIKAGDVRGVEA